MKDLTQTEQITELSLENSKLQREILKLKGKLKDKNISILKATILLQEVINNEIKRT
jgi:hypothetical protein